MKIETQFGVVEVTDIPSPENLTSITVNLQDQMVEVTYKGYISPYMIQQGMTVETVSSGDEATMRYDGELDDPDHPPLPQVRVIPPR